MFAILILLLVLILFAILFGKEIKAIFSYIVLYIVALAIWPYWWGKILITLFIIGLILLIYEKICKFFGKTPFYDKEPTE